MGNQARVEQMSFRVREIHHIETRKRVEEYIETALMWRNTAAVRKETAMTPNYAVRDYSSNSGVSKPVEDAAISNADVDMEMKQQWELLQRALNILRPDERQIIELRYLETQPVYDYEVYNKLGMSERTYIRAKQRAIKTIGMALNIAVWFYPKK